MVEVEKGCLKVDLNCYITCTCVICIMSLVIWPCDSSFFFIIDEVKNFANTIYVLNSIIEIYKKKKTNRIK